jgi:hypothetical protein
LNIAREKNMTPFDKRCELLNYMMIGTYSHEPYEFFRNEEDLYIYSAVATHLELVTPGPVMIAHINRVFESWLYMVGIDEDTGFSTIWEIDPGIPKFEIDEFTRQDLYDNVEGDPYIKIRWPL